jgi:hypothetical protein
VNYIVEAAGQIVLKKEKSGTEEISVVFCVDISGSMCVTKPVSGKFKIKGDKTSDLMKELMKFSDGSDQFLEDEGKNQTYVSRMQCMKAAIDTQIKDMEKACPERKVGLVTFNNDVTIYGDGIIDP